MTNIPSEADFERAKRKSKKRYLNIDKIEAECMNFFQDICPNASHKVFVFVENEKNFV
ncbi:hypothetical protein [Leptospira montravelensis]|uniref:hypothetical protein n=1 Tax=Leptospira montravelensis TaxID=2484961 RepID=UPI00142D8BD6|nr:hypothetical protein [Leptospira montravelensis]